MKPVRITYKQWNYLKDDGTYLLETNVCKCYNFDHGYGRVQYNDYTENFVNSDGKTLLKCNIKGCIIFISGFSSIKINNVWYYIDQECNFYNSDRVLFKKLYKEYPNMRSELIDIIDKYTFHNVDEYFIWNQ